METLKQFDFSKKEDQDSFSELPKEERAKMLEKAHEEALNRDKGLGASVEINVLDARAEIQSWIDRKHLKENRYHEFSEEELAEYLKKFDLESMAKETDQIDDIVPEEKEYWYGEVMLKNGEIKKDYQLDEDQGIAHKYSEQPPYKSKNIGGSSKWEGYRRINDKWQPWFSYDESVYENGEPTGKHKRVDVTFLGKTDQNKLPKKYIKEEEISGYIT